MSEFNTLKPIGSIYEKSFEKLGSYTSKFSMSSWEEFIGNKNGFCEKSIILGQFNNILEYKNFTENSLNDILERREIKGILLE